MRRLSALCAAALVTLTLAGGASSRPPGGPVSDDPSSPPGSPLFDGAGVASVEALLGGQAPAAQAERQAKNLSLVGALKLQPFNLGVHGDVAAWKNLAFVGKWRDACPATGVDIIDISNPAAPVKIADTRDYADTSMEDMQVLRIGDRDILGIGLQDCGGSPTAGAVGLELYDITDPATPQFLSLFNGEDFGMEAEHGHVHELDLTMTPDGRALALLSSPDLEAITSDANGLNGIGDLLIVDITDPASPTLAAEWGVLDAPEFGLAFYLSVRRGGDARTQLHSVRANGDGTLAYLSYWDAGYIILDISDPENPSFVGRAPIPMSDEGNAHSLDEARGGNLLVTADEDYTPFHLEFTSSAFTGTRLAIEGNRTPQIATLPGRAMAGEVVFVGRGCPADPALGLPVADPYLADPAGKIALIERGLCRFDNKIARAQLAGAIGAIVFNNPRPDEESLVLMDIAQPTVLPDGTSVPITIPAIFVQRSTGLLLRDGAQPVTASAAAVFDGWGFMRVWNISNPSSPAQIGTFKTANVTDPDVALDGTWTIHNPEVRGSTVFASWYSDGIRVIDITRPTAPRELAFWKGAGAPADAPAVNIWSVVPHGDLLVASDRNYGLYILKRTP
jgi:hypothetical protein